MARAEQLQKKNKKRKQNQDVKFPSQAEMGMSDNEYKRFQQEQGVYRDKSGVLKQLTPEKNIERRRIIEGEDIYEQPEHQYPDPMDEMKREASMIVGLNFKGFTHLRAISPAFQLTPYSPSVIAKKLMGDKQ